MILEIEYYKGDTFLMGKVENRSELNKQIAYINSVYDRTTDNFVELLCRTFHWNVLSTWEEPDFVYDRDTEKLYKRSKSRFSD